MVENDSDPEEEMVDLFSTDQESTKVGFELPGMDIFDDTPLEESELGTEDGNSASVGPVVFLDSRVEDAELLKTGLAPDASVVELSADRDGIEQISEALSALSNVSSVHIVSHGGSGSLLLGDAWLDSSDLQDYTDELSSWQESLSSEADILFYGCDLAADDISFLETVGAITGADVAASDDLTGSSLLGGDWQLEASIGEIDTDVAFSDDVASQYGSTFEATADIGGIQLWLDASDRSTILDGAGNSAEGGSFDGNVETWLDKSGMNNAARHVGTSDAIYNGDAIEVQGGADPWAASQSYFTLDNEVNVVSFVAVFDLDESAGIGAHGLFGSDGNDQDYVFFYGPNTTYNYALSFDGQSGRDAGSFTVNNGAVSSVGDNVRYDETSTGRMIGSSAFVYGEFASDSDDGVAGDTFDTLLSVYFGKQQTAGFDGEVREIIAFDHHLNSTEQQVLGNYLSDKWDIDQSMRSDLFDVSQDGGPSDYASGFNHDISGIGLEADGAVKAATSGGLTVTNSNLLEQNGDYFLIGHDDGASNHLRDGSTGINYADKTWYGDATGTDGRAGRTDGVTLTFDLRELGLAADADVQLLAGDSVASLGDTGIYPPSIDTDAGTVTFSVDADNLDGKYFTIADVNEAPIATADYASTTENGLIRLDVLANDSDPDKGDVLNLLGATITNGGGTIAVNGDHLTFDPGQDFDYLVSGQTTSVTVEYSVSDPHGAVSASTVTITVVGTNDSPVAQIDEGTTTENSRLKLNVLANDTDADAVDKLTLNSARIVTGGGTVSVIGNELVFDPGTDFDHLAQGDKATVTVQYAASDSEGATAKSTATITVVGTNDGPVAQVDTGTIDENSSLTLDVLANDADPDAGDTLALESANVVSGGGSVSVVANELVFEPGTDFDYLAEGDMATVTVEYTASDSRGAATTSTATITVTGTNDGPSAQGDTGTIDENSSLTLDVLANDTDLDAGDTLTLDAANITSGGGTVSIVGNELVFDPGTDFDQLVEGDTTTVAVEYTASDSHGAATTSTATITVIGTNDGPIAQGDTGTTDENSSLTLDVLANDTDQDAGDTLTLDFANVVSGGGSVSVLANELVFDPGTDFDYLAEGQTTTVTVEYTASDSRHAATTSTATITVTGTNDGPIAQVDTGTNDENTSLTLDVLANDVDLDAGDTLTLDSANVVSGGGSVSVVANELVFDPGTDFDYLAEGDTATVTVEYTASDSRGATTTSTAKITVIGTNDGPLAQVDTGTTDENSSLTLDVLANDTDLDAGDTLTLDSANITSGGGSVSVLANELVFVPGTDFDYLAEGDTATVTVEYTASDSRGAATTSTATITVIGTNDGPIAQGDTGTTDENSSLTLDVLANDSDLDAGDTLTLDSANVVSGGGSVSVVANELVFDPGTDFDYLAEGQTTTVTVEYTASDSRGAATTSTATITVTGTNDGPIAQVDTGTTEENSSLTLDVLANDTDQDAGDTLTLDFANVVSGGGSVSVLANELVFDPGTDFDFLAEGQTTTVTVEYTVSDSQGAATTSTATITITGSNDRPIAQIDKGATDENRSLTLDVLANDTDLDARDTLTLHSPNVVSGGGSVSVVANELVFEPGTDFDHLAEGQTTTVTVEYTASDSRGAATTSTATITVTGTNDGPIAKVDTGTTDENSSLTLDVLANDADLDTGDALLLDSANVTSGGGTVSVVANELVFDPGADFDHLAAGDTATVTVEYTVSDSQGATTTSTATITVVGSNDGPIAQVDTGTSDENSSLTLDVLANDTDLDTGDALLLDSANVTSGGGTVSVVANELVFDPGADFDHLAAGDTATVTVEYTVSDSQGATTTSTATITVVGSNDGPIAQVDTGTSDENSSLTLDVLANDADPDAGDTLTLDSANVVSGGGSVSVVANELVFEPGTDFDYLAEGDMATLTVEYTASDSRGAATTSTATITVTGTNDGPIAQVDTGTTGENSSLTLHVLANDTDLDAGDTLTLDSANVVSGGGSVSVVANELVFEPGTDFDYLAEGDMATLTVEYTASDSRGAATTSTATITVTGTNDGPIAQVDTGTTGENSSLTLHVLANDTDLDAGDTLTLDFANVVSGGGSVSVVANELVFDPGTDFDHLAEGDTEIVTVQYAASDSQGASSTSTATITVIGTNDGPIAQVDTGTTDENSSLTLDVLANDTDLDTGDALLLDSANVTSGGGTVSVVANELVFDPGADFDHLAAGDTATVTVEYTVSDSQGATTTSTATITVVGSNDGPITQVDTGTSDENSSLTLDVLANDADPDAGDTLTLDSANVVSGGGSVSVVANELVFEPGTDFDYLSEGDMATLTVEYTASDSRGAATTSTATITVTGSNDGPIAQVDTGTIDEDSSLTLDVLANDVDLDAGDTLTLYSANVVSGGGTVSIVANELVFDPGTDFDHLAEGDKATVTVEYTASDSRGAATTSTATITVTGTNDGPVAHVDTGTTDENSSLKLDVLANDSDLDTGDTLTLDSASVVSGGGTVSVVANELVFEPGADFDYLADGETAAVQIQYTASDSTGAVSTSSVTITVHGKRDGTVIDIEAGKEKTGLRQLESSQEFGPYAAVDVPATPVSNRDIDQSPGGNQNAPVRRADFGLNHEVEQIQKKRWQPIDSRPRSEQCIRCTGGR